MTDDAYFRLSNCICPYFKDIAPALIADLTCPVHGVEGTDPGDTVWRYGGLILEEE